MGLRVRVPVPLLYARLGESGDWSTNKPSPGKLSGTDFDGVGEYLNPELGRENWTLLGSCRSSVLTIEKLWLRHRRDVVVDTGSAMTLKIKLM